MMKNSISERIEKIIYHYHFNKNSFSKELQLSNNVTIGNIINKKSFPSFEIIYRILKYFPEINCRWLITGEGEMLRKQYYVPPGLKNVVNEKKENYSLIVSKDEEIKFLKEQIKFLQHLIEEKL